jgi:tape measure domain-containing protein
MAITVQEAQVIFSADGMRSVDTQARKASGAMDMLTAAAKRSGGALGSIRGAFGGIQGALAGVGAAAAVGKMMDLSMEAEKTAIGFEVLLGSADDAKSLLEQIRDLDKKTVFGTQELSQAQKLMMNFGMASGDAFGVLTNLTEVAQGDTEQLMLLARGMAQVQAAGRLMGQEANQLINSGFSPLLEISRTTGRSMADLKKDMEEGKISYDMVRGALEGLTTGTGRLAGMNERMSQTTAGMYAKFKTQVEMAAISIGNALLPEVNKLLEWINKNAEGMGSLTARTSAAIAYMKGLFTTAQDALADMAVGITTAFVALPEQLRLVFSDIRNWIGDLVGYVIEAGKTMAHNLDPAVWMTGEAAAAEMPTLEFSAKMSGGLLQQIRDEIDTARRIREGAIAGAAGAEPKKAPDRPRGPAGAGGMVGEGEGPKAAAEALKIERGGALQVFQRLQDQLRQADMSLVVQKQQLDVQQQSLALLGQINGGLGGIATLGLLQ